MKTLIFYATKHGATREIARQIAEEMGETKLCDLKNDTIPGLADVDCIIVGSSVYAGGVHKEVKNFLSENAAELQCKRFGLFLSGMGASSEKSYFESNFPAVLLQKAKAKSFLGGIYDPKKAGFMGRLVMKAVAKQSVYSDTIDNVQIKQFAEVMRA